MGKFLLICCTLCWWVTTSYGQTGEKSDFVNTQQPFVENNLRQVNNPIEFYPNPSKEFLNIEIKDKNLQNVEFEIYNIIGNSIKIEVEEVSLGLYRIPVGTLSQGYYLLVVQDKENRFKQAYKFQKK